MSMSEFHSPTVAVVHLSAIEHNYRYIQKLVGPKVEIAGVVKADGYGHGLLPVAQTLYQSQCRTFCIATIGEAEQLRAELGSQVRLLKLVPSFPEEFDAAVGLDLEEVLVSSTQLRQWSEYLRSQGKSHRFHLKIDRGMGRLGFSYHELQDALPELLDSSWLEIVGVMSHLPAAEEPPRQMGQRGYHTSDEINRFYQLISELEQIFGHSFCRHIANSGATLYYPHSHLDMVRVGLALYGVDPRPEGEHRSRLKPALSLHSRLLQTRDMQPNATVGYGRTYQPKHLSRLGVVPVGYAEGYQRALGKGAHVLIHGKRCAVVGRISMSLISVDLSSVPDAQPGDKVTLLGWDRDASIRLHEMAAWAETIPYELMTSIGRLCPRLNTHESSFNLPPHLWEKQLALMNNR